MAEWLKGPVDASAKDVKYDERKISRMKEHLGTYIREKGLQGASFLLARHGKVFAHESLGRLTYRPDSPPLKPDSIKPIASLSKVFTATALMKLVEDGFLWLDQPVAAVLKEFDTDMHRGIKLRHLLTHTSGLRADDGYWSEPYPFDSWGWMQGDDWLTRAVLAGPVQARPGEQWNYCSLGFAVLAEIVSRVSGRYFDDFLTDEVLKPLGMNRTFLDVPKELQGEVVIADERIEKRLAEPHVRKGAPRGGGGLLSTLRDLFVFGQCFLNEGEYGGARILGKKTCQEMTRNQLKNIPSYHWGTVCKEFQHGLGWSFFADGTTVGPDTYNHDGWGWCALFVDPVEEFIYVSFVASSAGWNPDLVVCNRTIAFSGIT
jgi:CubicO group peptidase (beta-lactamase class C family)